MKLYLPIDAIRRLAFLAAVGGLLLFGLRAAAQPAQIQVFEGTTLITSGQTTPVNLGSVVQGQSPPSATFIITNAGGKVLDVESVTVPSGYTILTNAPGTILGGSSAPLTVQLNSSAVGTYPGNIVISNAAPGENPFVFAITGSILSPSIIMSLSGNLSFGVVAIGSAAQSTLTISNNGDSSLTVTNIVYPARVGGNWTGGTIAAGQSQPVLVTFSPATATNYEGFITVVSDATSGAGSIPVYGFGANDSLLLTVITNGEGMVLPIRTAKPLLAKRRYTLTAIPKTGSVFSNWTGSIMTNKNPLIFTMESNMVLQANFIPNPFLPVKGTYNGLFSANPGVTEETAGMLKSLTIGANGTYSGALFINGAPHAISGVFDLAGQASNHISRIASQGGPLTVLMTVATPSNSTPQIIGTVSGANWTATNLLAYLAPASGTSGEYTLLFLPDTNNAPPNDSPGGDGYALITNHLGKATISGALADGTAFSQTVPVAPDGSIPLYANLYVGKGLFLGWINLELTNQAAVALTWIHPRSSAGLYRNGFTNVLNDSQIQLSPWTDPPSNLELLTNLSLLDIINDTNGLAIPVTTEHSGAISGFSVTGTINLKTGFLKVTIGKGADKTNAFGAISPNGGQGGGYFLTKTNAQAVQLGP